MLLRRVFFLYGVVAYVIGVPSLVYAIGFLANEFVPKGIDTVRGGLEAGEVGAMSTAVLVNVILMLLLPAQHTIMARPAFKKWWTRFVPPAIERSTFVLISGLLLWLLFWQWRPLPEPVWEVYLPALRVLLTVVYLAGWGLLFSSSFLIDHFDLFGLRQVFFYVRKQDYRPPMFAERLVYKWIRHPLMAGFIVVFWAAPTMSQGRFLFAVVTTAYILVAIRLEERDLLAEHGEDYAAYQRRTSRLLPLPHRGT